MSFWSNWSDGKKWAMGLLSTVLVGGIGGVSYIVDRGMGPATGTRVRNGEICQDNKNCLSESCYPGPDGKEYCIARAMNCAVPGGEGARYRETIRFDGSTYECYRPGTGRATWRKR